MRTPLLTRTQPGLSTVATCAAICRGLRPASAISRSPSTPSAWMPCSASDPSAGDDESSLIATLICEPDQPVL
ncbi:hypothetical protein C8D88_13019, partial [Lentzea atacamensis]